jgi:ribosomal protein S18 acetylase RimI-like enzyme
MGAGMVRFHHDFDARRFILPDGIAEGYAWWLGREIDNPDAIVLIAEDDSTSEMAADASTREIAEAASTREIAEAASTREIAGYAYATIEDTDWSILLGPHAGFHDLWVEEKARRSGVGKMLVQAMIERFQERNIPQVVLMTAIQNEAAQKLAAELGFRQTMIEMTLELPAKDNR